MQLLDRFSFVDPDYKPWTAKQGDTVDGASIPRALWTLVGSAYTGDYRRASIVHDVACDEVKKIADPANRKKARLAADKMYYHACRAGGCSVKDAIIQYIGVRIGARLPNAQRWQPEPLLDPCTPRLTRSATKRDMERRFQQVGELVLAAGEVDDLDVIEKRFDTAFAAVVPS